MYLDTLPNGITASRTEIGAVLYTKFTEINFSNVAVVVVGGGMASLAASFFLPALLTVRPDARDAVRPETCDCQRRTPQAR